MPATLLNLQVSYGYEVADKSGDVVTQRTRYSEKGLQADMMLHLPVEDEDQINFGLVRISVTANPKSVPAMTPDETVEWLCSALKRML